MIWLHCVGVNCSPQATPLLSQTIGGKQTSCLDHAHELFMIYSWTKTTPPFTNNWWDHTHEYIHDLFITSKIPPSKQLVGRNFLSGPHSWIIHELRQPSFTNKGWEKTSCLEHSHELFMTTSKECFSCVEWFMNIEYNLIWKPWCHDELISKFNNLRSSDPLLDKDKLTRKGL